MAPCLADAALREFRERGFLVLEDALDADQLAALRREVDRWVEESRGHDGPFGRMLDGRARFDVEPGHCADRPALRRVASPTEISPAFDAAMRANRALDATGEIFGTGIRFHHAKINSKLPGAETKVRYHQDFLFDPHTNDDLMTVLFFLDDVTLENGPLEVVPGSHRGTLHPLWHDGTFTGAVASDVETGCRENAVPCTGPAGSACLMHARLLHGSAANRSGRPRTLFIVAYAAADAVPLVPNHVPSVHAGDMVLGREPGTVRTVPFEMQLPDYPKSASFFDQQAAQA